MTPRRITLTIDRVVSDRPGLTRETLAEALSAEIRAQVAEHGTKALGSGRALERASGRVSEPAGQDTLAGAVARATLGAVKR